MKWKNDFWLFLVQFFYFYVYWTIKEKQKKNVPNSFCLFRFVIKRLIVSYTCTILIDSHPKPPYCLPPKTNTLGNFWFIPADDKHALTTGLSIFAHCFNEYPTIPAEYLNFGTHRKGYSRTPDFLVNFTFLTNPAIITIL